MKTPNEMYVDGGWVPASDGNREDIVNPATEEAVDSVPVATETDLDEALAVAECAWRAWRALM